MTLPRTPSLRLDGRQALIAGASSGIGLGAAMAQAYKSGAYTMAQIAGHFGVHYMTVSRAVRSAEGG